MAADLNDQEIGDTTGEGSVGAGPNATGAQSISAGSQEPQSDTDDEDEEGEEEDVEPNLKYTRLTTNLSTVYRNGDSTSTFLMSGDKMVKTPMI